MAMSMEFDMDDFENLLHEMMEDTTYLHHLCNPNPTTTTTSIADVKTTTDSLKKLGTTTSCAICTDDFDVDQTLNQLPCSHWFHQDCILPWLRRKRTCPLCRQELPRDMIIPVNQNTINGLQVDSLLWEMVAGMVYGDHYPILEETRMVDRSDGSVGRVWRFNQLFDDDPMET